MRGVRGILTIVVAVIVVLVVLSFITCGREAPRQEGGSENAIQAVEVSGVTLGRSLAEDMTILDETTAFRTGDTIYASVRTEGTSPSATLAARWTFEDGQVVDESSRPIAPTGPAVTEFHIAKPDGWPVGNYEVVITLDNREVARESFRVEAGG